MDLKLFIIGYVCCIIGIFMGMWINKNDDVAGCDSDDSDDE